MTVQCHNPEDQNLNAHMFILCGVQFNCIIYERMFAMFFVLFVSSSKAPHTRTVSPSDRPDRQNFYSLASLHGHSLAAYVAECSAVMFLV
jgi:hypothetical protein